jgi:hypothetical protein
MPGLPQPRYIAYKPEVTYPEVNVPHTLGGIHWTYCLPACHHVLHTIDPASSQSGAFGASSKHDYQIHHHFEHRNFAKQCQLEIEHFLFFLRTV